MQEIRRETGGASRNRMKEGRRNRGTIERIKIKCGRGTRRYEKKGGINIMEEGGKNVEKEMKE